MFEDWAKFAGFSAFLARARAVCLITSSNWVDCSTGRSTGPERGDVELGDASREPSGKQLDANDRTLTGRSQQFISYGRASV